MDITIHRTDDLSASLQAAWHRAMDQSLEYANPFLAPEFALGIGRYRAGTRIAVLHEGENRSDSFRTNAMLSASAVPSDSACPTARRSSTGRGSPGTPRSC